MPVVFRFSDERKDDNKKKMRPWQARVVLTLAVPLSLILGALAPMVAKAALSVPVSPHAWAALGLAVVYGLGAAYYWILGAQCKKELAG